ncbi:MAG: alpha/beta hydrolase, partial [Chloroflexota bacterium]|nr:alpha/beta hydrolase [Chloroflexota bacterium]
PQTEQIAEHMCRCNHDYGRQLAQQGFLVFAPEQRGFGERRELEDVAQAPGQSSCRQASMNAMLLGRTMVGMRVWDVMRVIDYVRQTGLAKADTLACVGLSGGGTVTTFATAMDPRITTAVISGYFCTWQWSIMAMRHCEDNYIPGIVQHAEMADIGALIAPRPLLIEAGTEDPIFPLPGVHDAYNKLAKVYTMLEESDRLALDVFEGEHQWHGTVAVDWLRRWL